MNHSDLVLIGGGHTHVLLLRSLAMRPIPGVRVTLVSEKTLTPYSGMLPGFVAGHYSLAQTSIDLNRLCRRAGARWIKATVTAVEPEERQVLLADQASLGFDQLSIDIGSTPDLSVKGAREFATGVKPIAGFQQRWSALLEQSVSDSNAECSTVSGAWGVIGAGAGGVELVLAMAHSMRHCPDLRFHIIYRGARVLPGYPAAVAAIVERRLRDYGVTQHPNFSVTEVTAHSVVCTTGKQVDLTESIWCTGARGAAWPASSGLATTEKGFISVNRCLQSTSHPSIFAAGDIAEMLDDPRPKAGVYAVRQAPPLAENLRRAFAGQPLRAVKLQTRFLSLLSLGDREAVASRNGLVAKGRWVWRWKDAIDQKFMRQFAELQASMDMTDRTNSSPDDGMQLMHCGGCGSKLGPGLLMHNLKQVDASKDVSKYVSKKGEGSTRAANVMAEDASVWTPTAGTLSVQSIDGFRSFTADEYRFGRICANHALSDIYAMGATVTYAQAWINLTFSHPRIQQRDHLRMLQGIVDALCEQGAELTGGHSTEGAETHLAIVANGELMPATQWTKAGVQPGDVLVLSKGLGAGVILAADMQGEAQADAVDAAYESMLQGNDRSMQQLKGFSPHAVTDLTGFGLLGHLLEMLDSTAAQAGTRVGAVLDLSAIPLLFGARELATAGWRSSLYPQLKPYLDRCSLSGGIDGGLNQHNADKTYPVEIDLLLDPQTSGGLLACMAESDAKAMLATATDFVAIGRIELRAGEANVRFSAAV